MILPEKMADHDLQGMKESYPHLPEWGKMMMRHILWQDHDKLRSREKDDAYFTLRQHRRNETADVEGKAR